LSHGSRGHLVCQFGDGDDLAMEPWEPPLDAQDVSTIMRGLFYANVKLDQLRHEVAAIRDLLEDDGEEEEEDWL
jgi:hypothetical protein